MPKKKTPSKNGKSANAAPQAGAASTPAGPTSPTSKPYFMSVATAAAVLAVSTKTVRRAIKDGRLSATPFGRRVLISQGALQQFITVLMSSGWLPPVMPKKP